MTSEPLPPLLAIVILVNAGVITFAIGSRRARGPEPPRWRPTVAPAAVRMAAAAQQPDAGSQRAALPAPTPRQVRPALPAAPSTGSWEEMLRRDAARATGSTPTAIVAVELIGLERLRARLGRDAAHRLVVTTGIALRRVTRPGDQIGWDGQGRFRILLAGADQATARACVDLLTGVVAQALDGQRVAVGLAVGWGIRMPGGDLSAAALRAERQVAVAAPRAMGAS